MSEPNVEKGSVLSVVIDHLHRLLRSELKLAKAEVAAGLNRVAVAIGFLAVALVLMFTTIDLLAAVAVTGLVSAGFSPFYATMIVAGAAALIAAILIGIGVTILKRTSLVPTETLGTLKKDIVVLKENHDDKTH